MANPSLFPDARRKLVEGTEVLRTGGGAHLTAGECNAMLDRLADLTRSLALIADITESTVDEVVRVQLHNATRLAKEALDV